MNDDVVEMIRGMSFDRTALYQQSMRLGSGIGAVEKKDYESKALWSLRTSKECGAHAEPPSLPIIPFGQC